MQLFYSYLLCTFCSQPIAKLPIWSTTCIFVIFVLVTFCYITNDSDLRCETPFDHGHGFLHLERTQQRQLVPAPQWPGPQPRGLYYRTVTQVMGAEFTEDFFSVILSSDDWAGIALGLDLAGLLIRVPCWHFFMCLGILSLKQVPEKEHSKKTQSERWF